MNKTYAFRAQLLQEVLETWPEYDPADTYEWRFDNSQEWEQISRN